MFQNAGRMTAGLTQNLEIESMYGGNNRQVGLNGFSIVGIEGVGKIIPKKKASGRSLSCSLDRRGSLAVEQFDFSAECSSRNDPRHVDPCIY